MTYSLSNECAKNYCNLTILGQVRVDYSGVLSFETV